MVPDWDPNTRTSHDQEDTIHPDPNTHLPTVDHPWAWADTAVDPETVVGIEVDMVDPEEEVDTMIGGDTVLPEVEEEGMDMDHRLDMDVMMIVDLLLDTVVIEVDMVDREVEEGMTIVDRRLDTGVIEVEGGIMIVVDRGVVVLRIDTVVVDPDMVVEGVIEVSREIGIMEMIEVVVVIGEGTNQSVEYRISRTVKRFCIVACAVVAFWYFGIGYLILSISSKIGSN